LNISAYKPLQKSPVTVNNNHLAYLPNQRNCSKKRKNGNQARCFLAKFENSGSFVPEQGFFACESSTKIAKFK